MKGDVYQLGSLLYWLLMLSPLYSEDTEISLWRQMVQPDIDKRIESMSNAYSPFKGLLLEMLKFDQAARPTLYSIICRLNNIKEEL